MINFAKFSDQTYMPFLLDLDMVGPCTSILVHGFFVGSGFYAPQGALIPRIQEVSDPICL